MTTIFLFSTKLALILLFTKVSILTKTTHPALLSEMGGESEPCWMQSCHRASVFNTLDVATTQLPPAVRLKNKAELRQGVAGSASYIKADAREFACKSKFK